MQSATAKAEASTGPARPRNSTKRHDNGRLTASMATAVFAWSLRPTGSVKNMAEV